MNHPELREFLQIAAGLESDEQEIETESEREQRLIRERAKRLQKLAARSGRNAHLSLDFIGGLNPLFAASLLGLPVRVALAEIELMSLPLPPLPTSKAGGG